MVAESAIESYRACKATSASAARRYSSWILPREPVCWGAVWTVLDRFGPVGFVMFTCRSASHTAQRSQKMFPNVPVGVSPADQMRHIFTDLGWWYLCLWVESIPQAVLAAFATLFDRAARSVWPDHSTSVAAYCCYNMNEPLDIFGCNGSNLEFDMDRW